MSQVILTSFDWKHTRNTQVTIGKRLHVIFTSYNCKEVTSHNWKAVTSYAYTL